jgi:hypothetical protein
MHDFDFLGVAALKSGEDLAEVLYFVRLASDLAGYIHLQPLNL